VNEKKDIAERLREEVLRRFGSIKAFADAIGKSQQYVNVYLAGSNSPGPKVRTLMHKAGLDVAYVMTGRRGTSGGALPKELTEIREVMKERGIHTAEELRERLEKEEALRKALGTDFYRLILDAAVLRDKRSKYRSHQGSGKKRTGK
jgi:transcriptional regulator with XRE-family HTH domain